MKEHCFNSVTHRNMFVIFLQTRSNFVSIAEVLLQTFENEIEIYWITKGFHLCTLEISADFEHLKDLSFKLLEKEDNKVYM